MPNISKEQLRKRAEDLRLRNAMDLLFSYADSPEAEKKVIEMHKNNASVKDYVIALADGLKYGNWPWSGYSGKKTVQEVHYIGCPAYTNSGNVCICARLDWE